MATKLKIGDRVRHSAKFMRSVGLVTHRNFQPWTITGFSGPFAIMDEPLPEDFARAYFTPEEMEADPTLRFLRVNVANIERVK